MPLDEIREVLAEDDPDFTTKRLAMHRERLAERLAEQERMLRFLERLIDRGGTVMPYDVAVKHAPDQRVASLSMRTRLATIGEDIAGGFAVVVGALTEAATQPIDAPFIVFHDVIDEQTDGDVEICIPVPVDLDASHREVEFKVIAGGAVAATTHRGPYARLPHGYRVDPGPRPPGSRSPREIYLNDLRSVLPDDLLTEVQFPIDAPE